MKRVIIESPYGSSDPREVEANLTYLRRCMAFVLRMGHAPFASHGLYTQPGVLDDNVPEEREQGIRAGFAWREVADATWVFCDRGITRGMHAGIEHSTNPSTEHTVNPDHVVYFVLLDELDELDGPVMVPSWDFPRVIAFLNKITAKEWKP